MRCHHVNVRCIHGDEIIARRWRRVACLDCGKALKGMDRFHEHGCNWMEVFMPEVLTTRFIRRILDT